MNALHQTQLFNRRLFLLRSGVSLGATAPGALLDRDRARAAGTGGLAGLPHFKPKASASSICSSRGAVADGSVR